MIETNTSAQASTTNQIRARTAEAESIASLSRHMRGSHSFKINLDGVELRRDTVSIAFGARLYAEAESQKSVQANAREGASLLQAADSALAETADRLDQIKVLANELTDANTNHSAQDRAIYQNQLNELRGEIDSIAAETEFNGTKLLQGGSNPSQPLTFDIRVSPDPGGEDISISINAASVSDLSANLETASFLTAADTTAAVTDIDTAINALDSIRSQIRADGLSLAGAAQHAVMAGAEADAIAGERSDVQVDVDLARLVGQQIIKEGNVKRTDPEAELLRIGLRNASKDTVAPKPGPTIGPSQPPPAPAPERAATEPKNEFPPDPET